MHTSECSCGKVSSHVVARHDTQAQAAARIAAPAIASFRKVFPGSALGNFRAVTWSVS